MEAMDATGAMDATSHTDKAPPRRRSGALGAVLVAALLMVPLLSQHQGLGFGCAGDSLSRVELGACDSLPRLVNLSSVARDAMAQAQRLMEALEDGEPITW
eukprot:Skav218864  [mRNA]  locus=scaffold2417:196210:197068:+ [translate_table: standard]